MGRWEPDALGRLQQAAFELYVERGFEQTTAAQIAERAGLTERTFFRHFADKREVLFAGSSHLTQLMTDAIAEAPAAASSFDAVTAALEAFGGMFADRGEFARRRHSVISANPELQERELIKLASLSAAMAGALRERGIGEPAASLAAEAGMAVFRVAFTQWVEAGDTGVSDSEPLTTLIHRSLDDLKSLTR